MDNNIHLRRDGTYSAEARSERFSGLAGGIRIVESDCGFGVVVSETAVRRGAGDAEFALKRVVPLSVLAVAVAGAAVAVATDGGAERASLADTLEDKLEEAGRTCMAGPI